MSFTLTESAESSLLTATGAMKCSRPVRAVPNQNEISGRLDVPPPGTAGRSLADVKAR